MIKNDCLPSNNKISKTTAKKEVLNTQFHCQDKTLSQKPHKTLTNDTSHNKIPSIFPNYQKMTAVYTKQILEYSQKLTTFYLENNILIFGPKLKIK